MIFSKNFFFLIMLKIFSFVETTFLVDSAESLGGPCPCHTTDKNLTQPQHVLVKNEQLSFTLVYK